MVQGLLCSQPLSIIDLNEAAYEVLGFIRQFLTLEIESTFQDQFMQFFHGVTPEGNCAQKHDIQTNAGTPHVRLEAAVSLLANYLWRYVGRRSTLLVHLLLFRLELLGHTEITNLDLARLVYEYVVELDVAMDHEFALVDVVQT